MKKIDPRSPDRIEMLLPKARSYRAQKKWDSIPKLKETESQIGCLAWEALRMSSKINWCITWAKNGSIQWPHPPKPEGWPENFPSESYGNLESADQEHVNRWASRFLEVSSYRKVEVTTNFSDQDAIGLIVDKNMPPKIAARRVAEFLSHHNHCRGRTRKGAKIKGIGNKPITALRALSTQIVLEKAYYTKYSRRALRISNWLGKHPSQTCREGKLAKRVILLFQRAYLEDCSRELILRSDTIYTGYNDCLF